MGGKSMMKWTMPIGIAASIAICWQALGAAEAGKDLPSLKAGYEKSLTAVVTNYEATVKGWPASYVNALKTLQAKLQKDGNLDGWSDVKTELARFQADPKIEDANLSSRAEIQVVQAKYKELPLQASGEKNQKIVSLSQKYMARLGALQSELTKQGKMEDALAVNAEIKRVKTSPEVTSAEFEVSELEAKKARTQKDNAPVKTDGGDSKAPVKPDKPGPGGKAPAGKAPVEAVGGDDEVKIYEGKAPALAGVNFKNMQIRPTGNVGAKRKLNVSAMLGAVSDEEKSTDASYFSVSKSKSGSTSSRVRVGLKTVASGSVMENVTVVVEYYCKDVKSNSGKIAAEKMLVKHINVPKVDLQGVWIDCPEASTYKSSYSRTGGWGGDSFKEKSGKDFYGVIISVFESDKTLAFQGVSGSALEEYATTTMPEEKEWEPPPEPVHFGPAGIIHVVN